MKLAIKGALVGTAALLSVAGLSSAQAGAIDIGPGGVRVERGHRWDRSYDRSDCRTIIEHRTNGAGDDVTVRRRVCD
jgi:hypothetical protein